MKSKIIEFIIDVLVKKILFYFLPDKLFIYFDYLIIRKRLLNLNNPKSFSEKIQWIKIYANLEKYSKYVDKYEVRDYIEKTIGKKYLIPLLGVWDSFEEIPFEVLPKSFVLKATHGSGFNFICKNKLLLDKKELKVIVNKWLRENYYKKTREVQYKNCKPKIICEKYLEEISGELNDYKFFCFNGKPTIIQIDTNRYIDHKRDLMDMNWEKMPILLAHRNSNLGIKKPECFNEMIKIAKSLSKPFPFVRVDLYSIKKTIYFGELTFTPGNGIEKFSPSSADLTFGKLLDLESF